MHFRSISLRRTSFFALSILFCSISATSEPAQTILRLKAKAIDNSEIVLPKASGQQVLVLVIGFSKKSGNICQDWRKHLSQELIEDPRITYFEIAQLEGIHPYTKPLILHEVRTELSPIERAHFIPLYNHQDDWRKLVNFSAPDEPYLIVADPQGHISWQAHGPFSDSLYADLKKAVAAEIQKSQSKPN
jgi:hypothetical protein